MFELKRPTVVGNDWNLVRRRLVSGEFRGDGLDSDAGKRTTGRIDDRPGCASDICELEIALAACARVPEIQLAGSGNADPNPGGNVTVKVDTPFGSPEIWYRPCGSVTVSCE